MRAHVNTSEFMEKNKWCLFEVAYSLVLDVKSTGDQNVLGFVWDLVMCKLDFFFFF